MHKKYIIYVLVFILTFVLIFSLVLMDKVDTKVISFRKNLDITSEVNTKDEINIDLLVNNKNSYIVDETQIQESYLVSPDNEDIINLKIKYITYNNNYINYKKETYYSYTFTFQILLNIDTFFNWSINNTNLCISYAGNKVFNFNIGSVNYTKIINKPNEFFTITNILPVTTDIYDNVYLSGLMLGIRAINGQNFTLNGVKVLNSIVTTGKQITEKTKISDSNNFNEIMGFNYSELEIGDGRINLEILDEKTKYIFIPLYYKDKLIVNKFPLEFKITKDNINYTEYLYDYVFYEVQNETIKEKDIHIYNVK